MPEDCSYVQPITVSHEERSAYKEAWSEWIASVLDTENLIFGTWTFRDRFGAAPSESWARKRAEDLKDLVSMSGARSIFVVEGDARKRRHVHSLSDGGAAAVAASRAWWGTSQGFTAIREVRNSGGAKATSLYVAKYLLKGDGHVALGGVGWRQSTFCPE